MEDAIMKCQICGKDMKLYSQNDVAIFYKCPLCHYYKAKTKLENETNYDLCKAFDAVAEDSEGGYNDLLEQAIRILKHKFNVLGHVPETFLDIGCSEGIFVEAYKKVSGKKGSGIEVSRPKIERCKKRGLDVGTYDEVSGAYDFILMRHVIEHVDNPEELLRMVSETYCNKNGIICIETPNNECISNIIKGRRIHNGVYCKDLYPPVHLCGFTPRTFKRWKAIEPVKILTHNVYDKRWYYRVQNKNLKQKILTHISFSNNVVAFIKKMIV